MIDFLEKLKLMVENGHGLYISGGEGVHLDPKELAREALRLIEDDGWNYNMSQMPRGIVCFIAAKHTTGGATYVSDGRDDRRAGEHGRCHWYSLESGVPIMETHTNLDPKVGFYEPYAWKVKKAPEYRGGLFVGNECDG